MKKSTAMLTRGAVISAIYVVLSLILQPVQFGPVQFRVSEALVMLPLVLPESILGVTVGCMLANIASPFGLADVLIGGGATLVSAWLTYLLKNKPVLACLPPVIVNAFAIPVVFALSVPGDVYLLSVLYVGASEALVVFLLGLPLAKLIKRLTK